MSAREARILSVEFDLQLETDPLGATLDVSVPGAVDDDARQALLDSIERSLVGAQRNLVFQAVDEAHDKLAEYGSENDYDTAPIEDSFAGVDAERNPQSIHVEWHWEHEAAMFYEFGTSDHEVSGDPLLVFMFSSEEYPGLAEMFGDGPAALPEVQVSGLPEARCVRDSLNWFRREVGQA